MFSDFRNFELNLHLLKVHKSKKLMRHSTEDKELHYKEYGRGEPVIILHGLFGTLDNWQTIARQLAENHAVFALDQRNHGRSPHFDRHDYHSMVEDLRHFMESHWIFNASIIGHSMGGKTAMQFALEYPDMVKKLVVVDISPKAYPGSHHEIFDALLTLELDKMENRQEADQQMKQLIEEEDIRFFLMKNLTRRKDGGYEFKINLPVLYKHYEDILAAVEGDHPFEGPSLFIRGGRSRHIQTGDEVMIQQLFPKAVIKTIEKAGHWVHADAPGELLSLLKEFLA